MTYQAALQYIASLEPKGWRLGLDRMAAFCEKAGLNGSLGAPGGPSYIHVAGTNGKGSTTAYLQSLMVEAGFQTGAFFSPFVVDPRERVQFGRELIPEEDLAQVTQSLIPVAESFEETEFGGITEFEFKTAVGFAYWKQKQCEWVALEVGLGGRLDATNVVTPAASIVVSVGLDHVSILGDTLAKIAAEKAGIIKPGIPVVMGDLHHEAAAVVTEIAKQTGAPLWRSGQEVQWDEASASITTPMGRIEDVKPGLVGVKQGHNLALAVAAMQAAGIPLSEDAIRRGAANAFAPGRFQTIQALGTTFVFDGAHNTDSAKVLRQTLQTRYPNRRIVMVTNMVQGHDPDEFYREIAPLASAAIVAPIDFHRAFPVEPISNVLTKYVADTTTATSIEEALERAAQLADSDSVVLVTGSFYLVGDGIRSLSGTKS